LKCWTKSSGSLGPGRTGTLSTLAVGMQEPFFLIGPKLPDGLDMSEFATESLRAYWRVLSSLALIHDLSYKWLVDKGKWIPQAACVLLLEEDRFEELIERFSSMPTWPAAAPSPAAGRLPPTCWIFPRGLPTSRVPLSDCSISRPPVGCAVGGEWG